MTPNPPARGLMDAPILLAMRRGDLDAHGFGVDLLRAHGLDVSELSAMALLAASGNPTAHGRNVSFLGHIRVHRITAPISRRAFQLLVRLPTPAGLTADDAIIAATALAHKLPLYTLDPAKFAGVPNLTAVRPY